jgi:hypothetical protein
VNALEAAAILTRANAAISWAAAGDRENTASNWDALVRFVGKLTDDGTKKEVVR